MGVSHLITRLLDHWACDISPLPTQQLNINFPGRKSLPFHPVGLSVPNATKCLGSWLRKLISVFPEMDTGAFLEADPGSGSQGELAFSSQASRGSPGLQIEGISINTRLPCSL